MKNIIFSVLAVLITSPSFAQIDLSAVEISSFYKNGAVQSTLNITIEDSLLQDFLTVSGDQIDAVSIYTGSGKLILKSDGGAAFNLSTFPEGIYILRVESGSNSIAKRLMKV